jgi:HK97 gp10 family phage protein
MITGLQEVLKALSEAGKAITDQEVKKIVRDEAKAIINTAQSMAPSQDIKESIGFIERNENKFTKTVLIGPRYYGGFRGQLSHTFEYGTAERFTKDGKARGFIIAQPFMRPALDQHKNNIVTNVPERILKLAIDTYNKN